MSSLATVDQFKTWTGRSVAAEDEPRLEMLLEAASQLLRGAVGQDFSRVENDEVVLRPDFGSVRLPQLPADQPTAVAYAGYRVGGYPASGAVYGWGWDGLDTISGVGNYPVAVTYSHGDDAIPADVVGAVCTAVDRALGPEGAEGTTPGVTEEAIDDYRYKLATPAGTVGFVGAEVDELRRAYGRRAGSIRMRA